MDPWSALYGLDLQTGIVIALVLTLVTEGLDRLGQYDRARRGGK